MELMTRQRKKIVLGANTGFLMKLAAEHEKAAVGVHKDGVSPRVGFTLVFTITACIDQA